MGKLTRQRIASLLSWASGAEASFAMWVSYKAYRSAFEAEQQRVLALTDNSDYTRALKMVYSGAVDIGRQYYVTVVVTFIGAPLSGDMVAIGLQIAERFAKGAVFVNDGFINYLNSELPANKQVWATTTADFTVLTSASLNDIVWAVTHETLHLDPSYHVSGMDDPRLMDIESQVNRRTGDILGRSSPLPGFPGIVR